MVKKFLNLVKGKTRELSQKVRLNMDASPRIRDAKKEKIMPRPKGSKNKSALAREAEQPREFDYERDDVMFDNSYRSVEPTAAVQQPAWTLSPQDAFLLSAEPQIDAATVGVNQMSDRSTTLYLVEGEVQMAPRQPGHSSVVAKQFRLVESFGEEEAVGKFVDYFNRLSDAQSQYSVIRAAAMGTIR
jgi:hypothetical protein